MSNQRRLDRGIYLWRRELENGPRTARVLCHLILALARKSSLLSNEQLARLKKTTTRYLEEAKRLSPSYPLILKCEAVIMGFGIKLTSGMKHFPRYREKLNQAIEANPEDPCLYFMRGQVNYPYTSLGWPIKEEVKKLLGKIPIVTHNEVIDDMLTAYNMTIGWLVPLYYLGKMYIHLQENGLARKYVRLALNTEPKNEYEVQLYKELHQMWKELNKRYK